MHLSNVSGETDKTPSVLPGGLRRQSFPCQWLSDMPGLANSVYKCIYVLPEPMG
jgi:hypothetical protein